MRSPETFDAYYAEAQASGFAVVTTPFGQVQPTSLEWFQETIAADPTGDIAFNVVTSGTLTFATLLKGIREP